jgi:hypothetical protein
VKPWPSQLNDGLRLYTNCFPGYWARILRDIFAACSTLGPAVSTHSRSAYGANAMARLVAAVRPAR